MTSSDLTYGFALFRDNHSMVTQMQVVPGHENNLLWTFEENGTYSIRSTEYSGPAGDGMVGAGCGRGHRVLQRRRERDGRREMSQTFTDTLVHGNERAFKPSSLTPLQKLTLLYVVFGLVCYAFAAIEGMFQILPAGGGDPNELDGVFYPDRYAMLTAHPLVGIFGSSYLLVMGAFTFLVPFLTKKPLWSFTLAQWTLRLIVVGVFTFWFDGFLTHYAPLYALTGRFPRTSISSNPWPGRSSSPVSRWSWSAPCSSCSTSSRPSPTPPTGGPPNPAASCWAMLLASPPSELLLHRQVVEEGRAGASGLAAGGGHRARHHVNVLFNAGIILFTGVLILVYMVSQVFGKSLKTSAVDSLLYKNWFWWGLDLVADGLVLVFVAGTWYLLAQLITGREVFMARWARFALGLELVVSWTVWSHHLLSDQSQPALLKMGSGEFVTAFELITQGLAFFITLVTLWLARPLEMTNPLEFLLGGLLGFALAVPAASCRPTPASTGSCTTRNGSSARTSTSRCWSA